MGSLRRISLASVDTEEHIDDGNVFHICVSKFTCDCILYFKGLCHFKFPRLASRRCLWLRVRGKTTYYYFLLRSLFRGLILFCFTFLILFNLKSKEAQRTWRNYVSQKTLELFALSISHKETLESSKLLFSPLGVWTCLDLFSTWC